MPRRLGVKDVERCVGCQLCMFACVRRYGQAGLEKAAILVRSVGGVERGFTVVVCRACRDPPCARVCPEEALVPREGGGVVFIPKRCTGCGLCRTACVVGAVFWDHDANKPIICVHCGRCVEFCPHGVLAVEEVRA